jgi:chain length determinant protein EpsF
MSLQQLFQILRGRLRLIIVTIGLMVTAAAAITFMIPNTYVAKASLLLSFDESVPYKDVSDQVQLSNSYMITQVNIIESHEVAATVVDKLQLTENRKFQQSYMLASEGKGTIRDWLADWLLTKLTVAPSRASRVVDITFASTDPAFAAEVANAFAEAYIDTRVALRAAPARESSAWLEEQLKPLRQKIRDAQARLTAYQQENKIVATDERLDIETARLQMLSNEVMAARKEALDAQEREKQKENLLASGRSLETMPEILGNSYIQAIKSELLKRENELLLAAYKVSEEHPQYRQAKAQVRDLKRKLNDEIGLYSRTIGDNAKLASERVDALEKLLAEQKQKILKLKRSHDDITVLSRYVDSTQHAYDDALSRFNQVAIESQVRQTNAALFSKAVVPIAPESPKLRKNLVVAAFVGLLLGIGLAFVFELGNRRIRSTRDVENELGMPALAVLGSG